MAAQTTLAASEQLTSARIGYAVRRGGVLGFYDDAAVAAATDIEDLKDAVDAAVVHAEYDHEKLDVKKALDFGKANGDFSDARVQAATSVDDLVALTWADEDPDSAHLGPHMIA